MQIINKRYQYNLKDKLGQGAFGLVLKGTDILTGEIVAIK
jgi:hypothetical protein